MTRTALRSGVLPSFALLLVAGAAAPAGALTVTGSTITGDNGDEQIVVSCSGGLLTAGGLGGDPCGSTRFVHVNPAGANDLVDLSSVTAEAFPVLVSTSVRSDEILDEGDGYDTVVGSPLSDRITADGHDTVQGGAGNDLIEGGASVDGDAGDDTMVGSDSETTTLGGTGDDRFVEVSGTGGVDGGSGTDSYEVDFGQQVVALGDEIGLVLGADAMAVRAGSTTLYSIPVRGIETVDITLLTGEKQTWDGAGFSGQQRVRGLGGVDLLTGGPAADVLHGGSGNDTLAGMGGADELVGGEGDDTLSARDGAPDRIDCGAGTDTVEADALDVVVGCETVQLPAVVSPIPAPSPTPIVPVTGAITGRKTYAKPTVAKFGFRSPTPGATFQCKLDRARWKACTSRRTVRTAKLALGRHTLRVRAVLAGTVDPTPSVKKFRVTAPE